MTTADHEARTMAQAAQATAERATDLLEQHVTTCGERAEATITVMNDFREESREARKSNSDSMRRLHTRVDSLIVGAPQAAPAPAPAAAPANGSVDKLESRLWRALGVGLLVVVGYLLTEGPPWASAVSGW